MDDKRAKHLAQCRMIVANYTRNDLLNGLWTTFQATQGDDTSDIRQAILERLAAIDGIHWIDAAQLANMGNERF